MARKKIREYDSKRLLKEHMKRLAGIDLPMNAAQVSGQETETLGLRKLIWLQGMRSARLHRRQLNTSLHWHIKFIRHVGENEFYSPLSSCWLFLEIDQSRGHLAGAQAEKLISVAFSMMDSCALQG